MPFASSAVRPSLKPGALYTASFVAPAGQTSIVDLSQATADVLVTFPQLGPGKEFAVVLKATGSAPGAGGFLLNFNGTNASTTFVDSAGGLTQTAVVGSGQLSTTDAKYGSACGLFASNNSGVRYNGEAIFAPGAGPFTVQFWCRMTSWPNEVYFYDGRSSSGQGALSIRHGGNAFRIGHGTDVLTAYFANTSRPSGSYFHFSYTRDEDDNGFVHLDGVLLATVTDTRSYGAISGRPVIGNSYDFSQGINGRFDDFHFVKAALYGAENYTPPAALEASTPLSVRFVAADGMTARNFDPDLLVLGAGLTRYHFGRVGNDVYLLTAI